MTSYSIAPRARRRMLSASVLAASAFIAAAAFAPTDASAAPKRAGVVVADTNIIVRVAPPTRRVITVRPARPGPRAVWTDGYWRWNGAKHVWVGGRWVANPRGTWVAGRWVKRPGGYAWVAGYWRR